MAAVEGELTLRELTELLWTILRFRKDTDVSGSVDCRRCDWRRSRRAAAMLALLRLHRKLQRSNFLVQTEFQKELS